MDLIRGRFSQKWINCPEDKRDYDIMRRGFMWHKERLAMDYCNRYDVPEISDYEKREIVDYWAQFGILIYDFCWHRMYYTATGIHDPRFVPDLVAGFVLYEYYNDKAYENTWRDKNMFDRLLPDVPQPHTLGKRIRKRYCVHNQFVACGGGFAEGIMESIKSKEDCDIIIKNTRHSGFGRGVRKYHISEKEDLLSAIKEWENCDNYIVQEFVEQHELLAQFNESSSNMIRVCSWRHGNDVEILYAAVRAGIPGSVTDVSFVNGIERVQLVGIKNGVFANKMLDQDGRFVKELPHNMRIPAWQKIVQIIKENHPLVDNFDIIGWDFTIDKSESPICFEWNVQWPGTVLYQYANGPLYGDMTEQLFRFLEDPNNKDNYIPYYMRIK